jgi:hypothetical protein
MDGWTDEEKFITNITIKNEAFSGYEPRTSWLKKVEAGRKAKQTVHMSKKKAETDHNTSLDQPASHIPSA